MGASKGGEVTLRLISSSPAVRHAGPPCGGTIYAPCYFKSKRLGKEFIYGLGGGRNPPPFVDPISVSVRQPDGSWSTPVECINNETFWWQSSPAWQRLRAERSPAYISGCGGPAVYEVRGKMYMLFPGCTADLFFGSGDHSTPDQRNPWNHFAIYQAESDNGIDWRRSFLFDRHDTNIALKGAVFYREPTAADIAALDRAEQPHDYKGFSAVTAFADENYVHAFLQFWAAPPIKPATDQSRNMGQKNLYLRYSLTTGSGWRIWRKDQDFYLLPLRSIIPDWANDSWGEGNPWPGLFTAVQPTTLFPGSSYIATFELGANGHTRNCIGYVLSNGDSLTDWGKMETMESDVKTLDGTGETDLVFTPFPYERDGKLHVLYGSSDYNQDGKSDCAGVLPAWAQGYGGLEIQDAVAEITK